MTTQNLTRKLLLNQKKQTRYATAILDVLDTADSVQVATSADVYELFELPEGPVLVTEAYMFVETANNAAVSAVADLGFDGGDTLIDGADLTSAANTKLSAGTNAVVPQLLSTGGTVTFLPTYSGAMTAGRVHVVIGFVELEKKSGELMNYSAT